MMPLEFARDECANWDKGACLGVRVGSLACHPKRTASGQSQTLNGHPLSAHSLPECVLKQDQKCEYFERLVLPLANHGDPDFLDARRTYEKIHALAAMKATTCVCGQSRAPHKRFCVECRDKHRRKSNREAKNRERLSAVKAKNDPVSA
jgi:hypothetical protein